MRGILLSVSDVLMRSTRCRVKFRRFGPYVPTRLAHRPRRRENDGLRARVAKLEGLLEEAWRAGKRQAAPFSCGKPNSAPGRSGRRSGDDHGKHSHREPPGEVDEELDALLTARCGCGGEIETPMSTSPKSWRAPIRWLRIIATRRAGPSPRVAGRGTYWRSRPHCVIGILFARLLRANHDRCAKADRRGTAAFRSVAQTA